MLIDEASHKDINNFDDSKLKVLLLNLQLINLRSIVGKFEVMSQESKIRFSNIIIPEFIVAEPMIVLSPILFIV